MTDPQQTTQAMADPELLILAIRQVVREEVGVELARLRRRVETLEKQVASVQGPAK